MAPTGAALNRHPPDDDLGQAEIAAFDIGRLGHSHVCVLKKGDVELLSEIVGIVWESFDEHGAWKQKLAKELEVAGFAIDRRSGDSFTAPALGGRRRRLRLLSLL
jgi:hypothetical protein